MRVLKRRNVAFLAIMLTLSLGILFAAAQTTAALPDDGTVKKEAKIESQIQTGNDDVEVSERSVDRTSTGLDLHGVVSRTPQSVYLRFTGVQLPKDAKVTNAYLSFTSRERSRDNCKITVSGVLGEGAALSSAAADYKNLKFTDSSVKMTAPAVTTDQVFNTENLTDVLTEMQSNNSTLENFIFKVDGDETGSFVMRSYNSSATRAPKLIVEYSSSYGESIATTEIARNDAVEYGPNKSMDYGSSVKIGGYRTSSMSESTKSRAALRFPNVQIPEDAVIEDAHLELTTDTTTTSNNTSNMQIRVELGDGGQYTSTRGNISDRKYGATWVPFQMSSIKTRGVKEKTGNLASIIDEARLNGWKSGDALNFLFDGSAYIGGVYEGGSSNPPKLVVKYKYGDSKLEDTIVQDSSKIKNIYVNEVSGEGTVTSKESWAELYNDNDYPVMLSKGMYISDNAKKPEKFQFNGLYIPAKGFRVVYFDKATDQGVDHASFSLDSDGALMLNGKDSSGTTQTIDKMEYGKHIYDQSYGRKTDGGSSVVLFQNDSFNQSNAAGQESYPIKVSRDRGVYDTGFSLTVSSKAGATIHYTLDGSEPGKTKGTVYNGPIQINKSGIVKFYAFDKDGNSGIQPFTYVLRDNLKNEVRSGSRWQYKSSITDNEYAKGLDDFPIVSIAGDTRELRKIDDYFQTSMEYLGKHVNQGDYVAMAGAKKFGQVSSSQFNAGVSVRFKRDYGSKKAKFTFFDTTPVPGEQFPVVKKFGKLQMKEGQDGPQNDIYGLGYNRYSEQATMTLGQMMGKFSLHTRYVHYYYNGQYMGLKTLREDFGDNTFEEYFGDDADNYTKINFQDAHFSSGRVETGDGNPALWTSIKNASSSGNFQEWKKYVDVDDFIKAQVLFMFIDTEREMEGVLHNDAYGDGVKMITNINDTDGAFHNDNKTGTSTGALAGGGGTYRYKWTHDTTSRRGAGGMFGKFSGDSTSLTAGNLEFKTLVKDQVLQQIGPAKGDFRGAKGAPLSVDNVKSVLQSNINELDNGYKLDAAFMSARSNMYSQWKSYQTKVLNQVDDRVKFSLESWKKYGMAHTLDPAVIQTSGQTFTINNPNATDVYYTTDGSDPMGANGTISSKAVKYTQGSTIPAGGKITARPFTTNNWGPISQTK